MGRKKKKKRAYVCPHCKVPIKLTKWENHCKKCPERRKYVIPLGQGSGSSLELGGTIDFSTPSLPKNLPGEN